MQPLTAKEIAAEVVICYLGMLCKWKTAVLAWFSAFQENMKCLLIDKGVTRKNTVEFWEGCVRFTW